MSRKGRSKVILILGGGIMQVPAIRLAKRAGWTVIVADANPRAPGIALADVFEPVDLADRHAMSAMAMGYRIRGELDAVFTAGTDFSTTVAWVAETCGLPGVRYRAALTATDKVRMRDALRRAAVPCPDYVGLARGDDPRAGLLRLKLPVVVKPVDNMGARGVRLAESHEDLVEAFESAVGMSRSGRVIVESYMQGPELSIDAIVHEGRVFICGVADRHIGFPPFFVELGHTMPSNLPQRELKRAIAVFKIGVEAIGIRNGAAKGDIKITDNGPMVGEIAARLSGGFMSGWTFPYSSGVEVTRAALNIALGMPPGPLEPTVDRVSAERALISIPGEIDDILGCDEAVSVKDVRDLFIMVEKGDRVSLPRNNVQKCGNVITCSDSREGAIAAAESAAGRVLVRLKPNNPATEVYLKGGWGSSPAPDVQAHFLSLDANRFAMRAMPERIAGSGPPDILGLPRAQDERSRDWHGLALADALERVASITGARFVDRPSEGRSCLGRVFWKALLKGGVQAAVYVVDTAAASGCESIETIGLRAAVSKGGSRGD